MRRSLPFRKKKKSTHFKVLLLKEACNLKSMNHTYKLQKRFIASIYEHSRKLWFEIENPWKVPAQNCALNLTTVPYYYLGAQQIQAGSSLPFMAIHSVSWLRVSLLTSVPAQKSMPVVHKAAKLILAGDLLHCRIYTKECAQPAHQGISDLRRFSCPSCHYSLFSQGQKCI